MHTTAESQHSLYLGTQMEVTEQDGRLRAGDDEDDEDEEQEAKHIVHLMGPASKEEFFLSVTCSTAVTTANHMAMDVWFFSLFSGKLSLYCRITNNNLIIMLIIMECYNVCCSAPFGDKMVPSPPPHRHSATHQMEFNMKKS